MAAVRNVMATVYNFPFFNLKISSTSIIFLRTYFIKTNPCSLSKDLSPEGDLRSLVKEKAAGGCKACKLFKWVLLSALVADAALAHWEFRLNYPLGKYFKGMLLILGIFWEHETLLSSKQMPL